ncbi:MAG: MBL fold metallo-hydrolase [Anaerolineales bacterium]
MDTELVIKFWGVRGSHPAPGAETVIFGGNTACVEIRAGRQVIILDAGTGIIGLGREMLRRARENAAPLCATLLFSHLHHDHTQGFPFFAPAYHPAARLNLFGPGASEQALEEILARNQQAPAFPVSLREMSAARQIRSLRETEMLCLDERGARLTEASWLAAESPETVVIRLMRSYAHPGGVYIYRITWRGQSVVYATDTEGYVGGDRRLAAFARSADLLIHDAQYSETHYRGQNGLPPTQGYGHSTVPMACEMARAAEVRQLALFHHDPSYSDAQIASLEKEARALFPASFAAREGLEVTLRPQHAPLFSAAPAEKILLSKAG